jgi:hypothetical protein
MFQFEWREKWSFGEKKGHFGEKMVWIPSHKIHEAHEGEARV